MTLPTQGVISLNAIHVEAGGSSATTCSINDADIRQLISSTAGTSVSFSSFYGASAPAASALDTQTVTTGHAVSYYTFRGYLRQGISYISYGSINDGSWDALTQAATINEISWNNVSSPGYVQFKINTGYISKTTFTSMKIGNTTFTSASSNYSTNSSTTNWAWTLADPFPTTGTNITVEWF